MVAVILHSLKWFYSFKWLWDCIVKSYYMMHFYYRELRISIPSPMWWGTMLYVWGIRNWKIYAIKQISICAEYLVHYNDVIMSKIVSQITSVSIVYSIIHSDADQRKHQSSAPLAFVRGIHRRPVNSPHRGPVTRKCFHLMTSSCNIT